MATFGNAATRNDYWTFSADAAQLYGQRFALAVAGIVESISVLNAYATAAQVYRLAVYADNGSNAPGTLKGVTAEMTLTSGQTAYAWRTGAITPVTLAAGNYFLCIWAGATSDKTRFGSSLGTMVYPGYKTVAYHATNAPPDNPAWTAQNRGLMDIYATYTLAATGCPKMTDHYAKLRR